MIVYICVKLFLFLEIVTFFFICEYLSILLVYKNFFLFFCDLNFCNILGEERLFFDYRILFFMSYM